MEDKFMEDVSVAEFLQRKEDAERKISELVRDLERDFPVCVTRFDIKSPPSGTWLDPIAWVSMDIDFINGGKRGYKGNPQQ